MRTEIRTNVINGKFKRNINLIVDAVQSFEGKDCIFIIDKATKKRSNRQNRYLWGILYPIAKQSIRDAWGEIWSIDKTHEFFKAMFLYTEKVNEDTGVVVKLPKSTKENTTSQQEDYHSEIRAFLLEWFNVDCPLPNEEITLNFD